MMHQHVSFSILVPFQTVQLFSADGVGEKTLTEMKTESEVSWAYDTQGDGDDKAPQQRRLRVNPILRWRSKETPSHFVLVN